MITLEEVKSNKSIKALINRTEKFLDVQGYTDHGGRHLNIVSTRAGMIAKDLGYNKQVQEYTKIAGWTHDMANFLSRSHHHYFGALLFFELFSDHEDQAGITEIMEAISAHDKAEAQIASPVTACLIIADKSDVHRSRVKQKDLRAIKADIHDRVNYAVTRSDLEVNTKQKKITLDLELDNNFTTVMDYFEIFLERMKYCKMASEYLGYEFKLLVNDNELA